MDLSQFNTKDNLLNYTLLLNSLENNTFIKKYPNYNVISISKNYVIKDGKNDVYVYRNPMEVTIDYKEENKNNDIFKIQSSIDLENFCKMKSIDLDNLYISPKDENEEVLNYKNNIYCTLINKENNIKLFHRKKRLLLPTKKFINNFPEKSNYKINEFTSFFKYYFINIEPESNFKYIEGDIRKIILDNLTKLLVNQDIKKYKFTGPYSIGKSITLLYFCRIAKNCFYINLKIINTKSRQEVFSILIEEFSNTNKELSEEIKVKLENKYYSDCSPMDAIIDLIKYFESIKILVMFVFDQHKMEYYPGLSYETIIKSEKNIKLVFCGSINDNNMREECVKTWVKFNGNNPQKLNSENQEYFLYYGKLYEKEIDKNNKLERMFKGSIKYINYYKGIDLNNLTEINKIDIKVEQIITDKIQKFIAPKQISIDLALTNIKSMINKTYEITELINIVQWCPLKYFVVLFSNINKYFKLKMLFPFLKNIINRKLKEDEIDNFFKQEKYLKSFTENDTIKGDYFEASVKLGLKNHFSLGVKIDKEITLKEIATMDFNETDDYIDEIDDNDEIEEGSEKGKEEDKSENNMDSNNNIVKEKEEEKCTTFSKDENKMNLIKNIAKIYSIDLNKEIKINDIEKYRRNELIRVSNDKNNIVVYNNNYEGEKNYLIDQTKKTGKMLDYALLFGPKNDKTFVGFQIKCYFQETNSIDKKFTDKVLIKKNCQQILFKSMILFNCKITKWHYFLIFYLNPKRSNCNVNQSILNKCVNVVGTLFYDPVNKSFYNSQKMPIEKLEFNSKSNLDMNNSNMIMDSTNGDIIKKFNDYNDDILYENFKRDFDFMKCNNIDNILIKIGKIMKIYYPLKLLHQNIVPKIFITPPNKNKIFLFKHNKSKNGFIAVKSIYKKDEFDEDNVDVYDLLNEIKIENNYYSEIDLNFNYSYTLEIMKKRNYNLINAQKSNEEKKIENKTQVKYFKRTKKDKKK